MKMSYFACLLAFSIFFVGCQTPIGKWFKAEKSVETTKKEIVKTDDSLNRKVIEYIYGADFTLSLAPTNRYVEVAKGFTERGLATSGYPSLEETLQLKQIVQDLLSTNRAERIKGEKALADKDEIIIELQQQKVDLNERLVAKEEKLAAVNAENAKLATTWKKITTGFWWIIWIFVIGFVLSILGKILPPPYNSIAAIVAAPIGLFVRILQGIAPSIRSFAGVVPSVTHDATQLTLEKLVLSIEELKKTKPSAFAELEPILKNKTDAETTRPQINAIKQDYGLV